MDFLTFKSFISIEVLIAFYYIGAVALPFGAWYFALWLMQKYKFVHTAHQQLKEIFYTSLSQTQKIKIVALFILTFLLMELFWRIFFEFLIAYIQIRNAVMGSEIL